MLAMLLLTAMAWAEEYMLEVGPLPERTAAQQIQTEVEKAGLDGRIVRRFRLGHGWEFVIVVEHLSSQADADAAAVRLGTQTGQAVTVFKVDGEAPAPLSPVSPSSQPAVEVLTARAIEAHGGRTGGAEALARAEAVHFVFERTLESNGKKSIYKHDYWREGPNRRLAVDGPEKDSIAVATGSAAWVKVSAQVLNRDIGVVINQVDAFAPEAILAVAVDVATLLKAPEVQNFRVLEGAESGIRIGTGGNEDEAGISFIDVDTETGRVLRLRYVTDGGPVVYVLSDYREVAPGLVVPFRVQIERGDGRRELLVVKSLEITAQAPTGTFNKPAP